MVPNIRSTYKSSQFKHQFLLSKFALVSLLVVNPLWAEDAKYREFKTLELQKAFGTEQPWKVTVYEDVNARDDEPKRVVAPVKLCFWHDLTQKSDHCHIMGRHEDKVNSILIKTIAEKDEPKFGIELISENKSVSIHTQVLHATIWTYNADNNVFENSLKPRVWFNDIVTQYRLFSNIEGQGIVVYTRLSGEKNDTGLMYWSQRYKIVLYWYYENRYQILGEYITQNKYYMKEQEVISQELPNIKRFVREQMRSKTH